MVVGGLRAQGDLLPGGVHRAGPRPGLGAEGAGAGAGGHQPFGGQLGQGAGDRHRADPVPFDQGAARWQLLTRGVAVEAVAEDGGQFSDAATLVHERSR